MKKIICAVALAGCCAAVFGAASGDRAQILVFKFPSGNWDNGRCWNGGKIPGANNYGHLLGDNNVSISSKIPAVGSIALGGENKTATLSILDGADVSVEATIFVPGISRKNMGGHLDMTGGTVRTGTDPESPRGIYVGTGSTYSGQGIATISGGTYTGGFKIGSHLPDTQTGTLAVVGSAPRIASPAPNHRLVLNQSGTILFVLDAEGVATLDFSKAGVSFQKGAQIIADGAGYKGGSKTFCLLRADQIQDNGAALSVRGFSKDYQADISYKKGKDGGLFLKVVSSAKR